VILAGVVFFTRYRPTHYTGVTDRLTDRQTTCHDMPNFAMQLQRSYKITNEHALSINYSYIKPQYHLCHMTAASIIIDDVVLSRMLYSENKANGVCQVFQSVYPIFSVTRWYTISLVQNHADDQI